MDNEQDQVPNNPEEQQPEEVQEGGNITENETENEQDNDNLEGTAPTGNEGQSSPSDAELYTLPDGRQVSGAELHNIYVNDMLPEFTRRSQRLAEYEKTNKPKEEEQPEYLKADWQPKTYAEIVQAAEKQAISRIEAMKQAEAEKQKILIDEVNSQVSELRKADPKLNEEKLFYHANKYKFNDLSAAYINMKEMEKIEEISQKKAQQNQANRATEPVSGKSKTAPKTNDVEYGSVNRDLSPSEALELYGGK